MKIENEEAIDYYGRDSIEWNKEGAESYTISEVIEILNTLKEKYGDIDVKIWKEGENAIENIKEFVYIAETSESNPCITLYTS
jgi:hypothetical protein